MIETPEDKTKFEILYTEYKQWMGTIALSILHNKQALQLCAYAPKGEHHDGTHNAAVCPAQECF